MEKDVLQLKVSVHDLLLVDDLHAFQNLDENESGLFLSEASRFSKLKEFAQISSVAQLGNEVIPGACLSCHLKLDDEVGVVLLQTGHDVYLVLEHSVGLVIAK